LIKRAVAIGDYYEAITNYADLEAQLAARLGDALTSSKRTPDASTPTTLTRSEYKELAQLHFWTYNDRTGLAKLLQD